LGLSAFANALKSPVLVHCTKNQASSVAAKAAALSVPSFVVPLCSTTKAFHVNR
jgi:hypothetical protein